MMIQPTVSHYREPLIKELLESTVVEYELFGLPTNVDSEPQQDRTRSASPEVLSRVEAIEASTRGRWRWDHGVVSEILRGRHGAYVLEGRVFTASTWLALLLGRVLRRPIFLWGHGWKRDEAGFKRRLRLVFYGLSRGLLLYGPSAAERAQAYGIDPAKLHVVYNSIYSRTRLDVLDRHRERPALDDRVFAIIVSCRLTPRHRIQDLATAVSGLEHELRNRVRVTIIGDGSERNRLEREFRSAHCSADFKGSVYRVEELFELYSAQHIAVSTSASGLNVIQALGFGVPILMPEGDPTAGPESDAVTHGISGIKFRWGSVDDLRAKLLSAINGEYDLAAMSEAGSQLARERYVAEVQAAEFDAAITRWMGQDQLGYGAGRRAQRRRVISGDCDAPDFE